MYRNMHAYSASLVWGLNEEGGKPLFFIFFQSLLLAAYLYCHYLPAGRREGTRSDGDIQEPRGIIDKRHRASPVRVSNAWDHTDLAFQTYFGVLVEDVKRFAPCICLCVRN